MVEERDMIAEAQASAERLAKENAAMAENIKRLEAIESRRILGGQSAAGEPVQQPKEETPKEYAARIMRGGQ